MKKTVNDLYVYHHGNDTMLLSGYRADFWDEYRQNHKRYDSLFRRLYKSFRYFDQLPEEELEEVALRFSDDVYNHLMINDKKYTELYRMYVIPDTEYSITDNYNMKEEMSRQTSDNGLNTYGSREDTNSNTVGSQTNKNTGKSSAYDSNDFFNANEMTDVIGQRSDSSTYHKGNQSDSSSNSGTEQYLLTRKGNIGVQTGTDMLDKHNRLWSTYEFYAMIFNDICSELLLI